MEFDISNSIKRFHDHLQPPENDRIIFSGKFGAGKTYFLRKFFEEKNEEYDSIHLFPINYSVASNEDIFELIKFDILFSLLEKGAGGEEGRKIPHDIYLYFYLQNKKADIATALLRFIPKIGAQLGEGADKVLKLIRGYNEEYKESNKDETQVIEDYLSRLKEEKGNIYEEDLITLIIKDLVEDLQGENEDEGGKKNKKVVLIIDDLDRIDPGHLFRILNVLSAHTDRYEEGDNKFGFDQIIIALDIQNVKNIYHHIYGEYTDFKGYIDKFYTEIYEYHLDEGLSNRIGDILTAINPENPKRYTFTQNTPLVNTLTYLLLSLITSRQLTVRNILNFNHDEYNVPTYELSHPDVTHTYVNSFPVLVIVDFLVEIFGDIEFVMEAFNKIKYKNVSYLSIRDIYPFVKSAIPIIDIDENKIALNNESYELNLDFEDIRIKYIMPNRSHTRDGLFVNIESVVKKEEHYREVDRTLNEELYKILFLKLMPETVKAVKDKNLLANRPS